MARELKFGLMERNMRGNGSRTRLTVKESSGMLMVTFMRVSGKMTKLMGTESTCM